MTTIVIIAVLPVLALAALGWWSAHGAQPSAGLSSERLSACGDAPNCVCSEGPHTEGSDHYSAPFLLPAGDPERQWQLVRQAVVGIGANIVDENKDYLHATVTSRLFRFVDDLELRRDGQQLHLRSASRVGYSDLGANARRAQALKKTLGEVLKVDAQ